MKTISNPQSIFGGRAFKVTALDVSIFTASARPDETRVDALFKENPFTGGGGGCYDTLTGTC